MSLYDFGLLSFGLTFAGLVTVIAEFGFSLMAQRDIPQNRYRFNEYNFNVMLQKIAFSTVSFFGGFIYLFLLFEGDNRLIGMIFLVYAVFTSYVMYFLAVFRATNKFKVEMWSSILYFVVIGLMVTAYFILGLDVFYVAGGILIARLAHLTYLLMSYFNVFGSEMLVYNKSIQLYLLKNSFSFGMLYIIGILYFTVDSQLVAYYAGNEQLAIYQSFFNIVMVMLMINELLTNVFLPYLSSLFLKHSSEFTFKARLINKVIFTLGLALFLFTNLFSEYLVDFVYSGKYSEALVIAIPLSLVLLFRVWASIYAVILTISEHQNIRVLIVFSSLIVNLVLNLVFIPKYGFEGAAYVSLVTHFVLVALYVMFTKKLIRSVLLDRSVIFFSALTIGLVLSLSYLNLNIGLFGSIFISLIWTICLYLIFNKKQFTELKSLFLARL